MYVTDGWFDGTGPHFLVKTAHIVMPSMHRLAGRQSVKTRILLWFFTTRVPSNP